jgi:hypothetical protein
VELLKQQIAQERLCTVESHPLLKNRFESLWGIPKEVLNLFIIDAMIPFHLGCLNTLKLRRLLHSVAKVGIGWVLIFNKFFLFNYALL